MTLDELASRLQKSRRVTIRGFEGINACCPAHEDKSPSFGAWQGDDGYLHFKCQKTCTEDEILSALGLTQEDRRVVPIQTGRGKPQKPAEACYIYSDVNGKPLYRKRRYYLWNDIGWEKLFAIERFEEGRWKPGLDKVAPILYNLAAVLNAVKDGQTIYINEGEKACDRMIKAGLVATCQPYGAGKNGEGSKWTVEYTRILKGANVVIIADRDPAPFVGQKYATAIYECLIDSCSSVKIVQSVTTKLKDDAYDHFQAGYTVNEFVEATDLMKLNMPELRTYNGTFKLIDLNYLSKPYLPLGKPVLLDGDGGVGKSSLMLGWAAALSNGLTPIWSEKCEPTRTLYLHTGEDEDEELETVYRANGGKCDYLFFYNVTTDGPLVFDATGLRMLKRLMASYSIKFLVIDSLFYFLSGIIRDTNNPLEVQTGLHPFRAMVSEAHIASIALRHTKKGGKDSVSSELGLGSAQFRNALRGQLLARWHPDKKGVVIVEDLKGTLLNERGPHFAYRRAGQYGEIQYIPDEPNPFEKTGDEPVGTKLERAKALLSMILKGKFVASSEVYAALKEACISDRTGQEAMKQLGVKSVKNMSADGVEQWLKHIPVEAKVGVYDPYADLD